MPQFQSFKPESSSKIIIVNTKHLKHYVYTYSIYTIQNSVYNLDILGSLFFF